jgi:hypothetical protein
MADDRPWDARILERIESGVDRTLLMENLALSPTERLERMQSVLQFVEDARAGLASELPKAT